jgi:folate-dependent phosphoribosylglycinamide formyltransferase PurN
VTNADPIRVVVFTGGPEVQPDVLDFVARLEKADFTELAAIFCESPVHGLRGTLADLWRRRGILMLPLLVQRGLRILRDEIFHRRRASSRRSITRQVKDRLHYVTDLHSASVLEQVESIGPDLGLVYGGPILRPELFEKPRLGTLGIHHGLTPGYRGKKTTFWAMYNGETHVGVTIQKIGSGLDRGEVVGEVRLPVGKVPLPVISARLERRGIDLYMQAIQDVRRGRAIFRPQPEGPGVLYRDPSFIDIMRFWARYLIEVLRPPKTK